MCCCSHVHMYACVSNSIYANILTFESTQNLANMHTNKPYFSNTKLTILIGLVFFVVENLHFDRRMQNA